MHSRQWAVSPRIAAVFAVRPIDPFIGGQPIGFSVGLTLGGVFADTVGWRWGFHMAAIINTVIFVVALFGLPNNIDELSGEVTRKRLVYDIDWIGALIAACSLGMLSYVFS